MKHVERSGPYVRVCDPAWRDPLDTSFAARLGGRWNAPGSYGVLYLNAKIAVAAANARRNYDGEIATLLDLRPEQRPDLQVLVVRKATFVDLVSAGGVRAAGLPSAFPYGVSHAKWERIGARAYAARENGIATRSNADATAKSYVGEELAVFDAAMGLIARGERLPFARWYPVETPETASKMRPSS